MIEDLIRRRTGLDPGSVGSGKFRADIARRMAVCGVSGIGRYERLLSSSNEEFDALLDLLTVPETWFFRAYDSFICLEEYVRSEWMPSHSGDGRKLRTLSIPCSTGEEPYSIAMTFLRCGLFPAQFSIEAFDINPASIERAIEGVYTKNSFRGELQWFKPMHFTPCDGRFALEEGVKRCVSFKTGNLLDFTPPPEPGGLYDIIFCRNLLIYFDSANQGRALDILSGLLREGGLLFMGHAESTSLLFGRPFKPVPAKGSFAFKRVKEKDVPPVWEPTDTQRLLKVFRSPPASASPRPPASGTLFKPPVKLSVPPSVRTVPPAPPMPSGSGDLAAVMELADKGLLKEAAELCRGHIMKCKLDPEGYFILGVILMSLKRERDAENFLNKAIFLKPDHFEALLSLAALKEGRGDFEGAELCRRRAGREAQVR